MSATNRAAVVAKITEVIERLTLVPHDSLALDKPVIGQGEIDSLDIIEIEMAIEDEFFPGGKVHLDPEPDWTIDKIADLVTAELAAKEGAAQ